MKFYPIFLLVTLYYNKIHFSLDERSNASDAKRTRDRTAC